MVSERYTGVADARIMGLEQIREGYLKGQRQGIEFMDDNNSTLQNSKNPFVYKRENYLSQLRGDPQKLKFMDSRIKRYMQQQDKPNQNQKVSNLGSSFVDPRQYSKDSLLQALQKLPGFKIPPVPLGNNPIVGQVSDPNNLDLSGPNNRQVVRLEMFRNGMGHQGNVSNGVVQVNVGDQIYDQVNDIVRQNDAIRQVRQEDQGPQPEVFDPNDPLLAPEQVQWQLPIGIQRQVYDPGWSETSRYINIGQEHGNFNQLINLHNQSTNLPSLALKIKTLFDSCYSLHLYTCLQTDYDLLESLITSASSHIYRTL